MKRQIPAQNDTRRYPRFPDLGGGGRELESPHPDHGSRVVLCCRASRSRRRRHERVNTITIDGETRVVGQFAGRLFLQEAWLPPQPESGVRLRSVRTRYHR
jgi:hypothetical protein